MSTENNTNFAPEAIDLFNKFAIFLQQQSKAAKPQLHLKEAFQKVLIFYSSERAAKTFSRVRTSTNHFLKYAGNVPIGSVNVEIVQSFFIWLRHTAPKGIYAYKRDLAAVWNHFIQRDYTTENPFQKYKLPKIQKSELITISRFELNQAIDRTDSKMLKDIFLFVFLTGLRAGEVVNLCWSEVNFDKAKIKIGSDTFITKGKKIRYVPLCCEAAEILHRNKPKIFRIRYEKQFVFCKKNHFPYTISYISKQFKKSVIASGINSAIHFHTLRHGFATALAKQGISIYKIQKLLGHSSVKTTEIYANLNLEDLRNAVKIFDNY